MEVFRLSREKYANDLSAVGSAIKGARWNSVGIRLLYTAQNRSLAMAEVAVHLSAATLPDDYVMVTLFVPDDISIDKMEIKDLPKGWNVFPHTKSTQLVGDLFVSQNRYCLLQVPSVVTQDEYNFLINPNNPEFSKIKIIETVKFPFDKRIFKS